VSLSKFVFPAGQDVSLTTLDRKLAISFALLLFVLMVTVLLVGGYYYQKVMAREEDKLTTMVTHTINDSITHVSFAGAAHVQALVEDLGREYTGIAYIIVADRNHRVIAASDPTQNNIVLNGLAMRRAARVFTGQKQVIQELTVGGTQVKEVDMPYRIIPTNGVGGVIRVGISMQEKIDAVRQGLIYIGLLVLLLLLFGVAAIYKISGHFGRPVKKLAWQLQGILEHAPLLIIIRDRLGQIFSTSGMFHKLFPRARGGGDENYYTLLPERVASAISRDDAQVFEKNLVRRIEETLEIGGEPHIFEFIKFPIAWAPSGDPILLCSIGLDVTARRRTEDALRQSEESLARAQAIANLGDWEWDIPGNGLRWSDEVYRIFGQQPQQFTTTYDAFLEQVHPADRQRVTDAVRAALTEDTPYRIDHRILLPGGGERIVHEQGAVIRNEAGEPVGMHGTVQDITERKQAEEMLFREKELAQVTLQSIGDAVITTDAEGRVVYLNPVAAVLTGWELEAARGHALEEVFAIINEITGGKTQNPVAKVLREGRTIGLSNHTVLISRHGRRYAVEDSAAPIRDQQGVTIGVVLVFHDVTKARELARKVTHQATHDPLTGLINRREFENRLSGLLDSARTEKRQHALLYLDLDQFKVVNDTCGHSAGDDLLRRLTQLLQVKVREPHTVARLGGDEFGVLLVGQGESGALAVADQLREAIQDFRFVWEHHTFVIGVSIGLVMLTPGRVDDIHSALIAADTACYLAKDMGRNRVQIYQTGDAGVERRRGQIHWVSRITKAMEEGRFQLYRQAIRPVAHNAGGDHWEILLRMQDEHGEIIAPDAFLPAAERYNLMPSVDRWVIRNAFDAYRVLYGNGERKLETFAINVSGASLGDDTFLRFIQDTMERLEVPPQVLCFEITETAAVANMSKAVSFIGKLKRLGCRFSLDDFGTGLSSFSYLKNFEVDYLKIDGAFVRDIVEDQVDYAMVEAIHRISRVMGIRTIAEFVENDQILAILQTLGVDFAQGYGIHKPEPLLGAGHA